MNKILSDKQAFATPLLLFAYSQVGDELFDLEPETINRILWLKDSHVPQCNVNKLNAALGLFTSNLFWQDPITFGITCRTLNRANRPETAPPDLEDVVWGVTEARLIVGNPDEPEEKFSDSVEAYIRQLLKMDSIVTEVPTLKFITPPEVPNTYDDPNQMMDMLNSSKERVSDLEQGASTKMIMLLKQIKDLHLDISKEASQDLENLLKEQG